MTTLEIVALVFAIISIILAVLTAITNVK